MGFIDPLASVGVAKAAMPRYFVPTLIVEFDLCAGSIESLRMNHQILLESEAKLSLQRKQFV